MNTRRGFFLQFLRPTAQGIRDSIYDAQNEFADAFNAWFQKVDEMLRNGTVDRHVLGERTHLEVLWMKLQKRVREWERG